MNRSVDEALTPSTKQLLKETAEAGNSLERFAKKKKRFFIYIFRRL